MREAGFRFYSHCPYGENTDAKTSERMRYWRKNTFNLKKKALLLEALNTARKTRSCMCFPPTTNNIRYVKAAQVQLFALSDFGKAPHFTKMNAHKLLFYAKSYFLHHCSAPLALSIKPGVRPECWCACRLHKYALRKKIHQATPKGKYFT